MPKSELAGAMDEIQRQIRPLLKDLGYRVRGRTFNRVTSDGLVQVLNFQMGPFDPPGTTYIAGLTQNLYGRFAVNLGVHVPEVHLYHLGGTSKTFCQEHHCSIRARLGEIGPESRDIWWTIRADEDVVSDVRERIIREGLPFLERFKSRDRILEEWKHLSQNVYAASSPPRIVCAIILAARGQDDEAARLLQAQATEPSHNPGHSKYVRELARKLNLGELNFNLPDLT